MRNQQAIDDALERYRNSGGFACSDPTDEVLTDLLILASAYDDYRQERDVAPQGREQNMSQQELDLKPADVTWYRCNHCGTRMLTSGKPQPCDECGRTTYTKMTIRLPVAPKDASR